MKVQATVISSVSGFLKPAVDGDSGKAFGKHVRLAMTMVMLSALFETALIGHYQSSLVVKILMGVMAMSALLVLAEKYSRVAIVLFSIALLLEFSRLLVFYPNHGWLVVWTVPAAAMFSKWWQQTSYSNYLRITLGVVMLAAAAQKLLAGTYIDGTYIAYMSYFGTTTENMFRFLCSEETLNTPCGWHRFLGTFIVLWQIGVGLLLIAGLRSLLFLGIEVGFLLGAGVYADEMNFQVLNIALLCIAFRVGMSYGLFFLCAFLLLIDMQEISKIIDYVI